MIRLFQTWRHLASEASSGHGQHHDLPRGGGKEESLTAWACSSNPALRSQSGWCYLSQCVWRNQPGPKQNGNMKLPGNTGFVGGLWDYVGRSLHITSFSAGGREGSYHGPSLTYGLGFFFCQMGPVSSEFWMWKQFNIFPLVSHTIVSHLGSLILWHKKVVRWPPLTPFLTSVRELFPVAIFCEIIQHLFFN